MAQTRGIQYIPKTQRGNAVVSAVCVDDATTDAQYLLLAAGSAGTAAPVTGVFARAGREVTISNTDAAGNISGSAYLGPFGTWSAPANTGNAIVSESLGSPIDEVTNNLLASTAITALPIMTTAKPDVTRGLSATGNAGSTSVLNFAGGNVHGDPINENVTLNGTATINTKKAFAPNTPIVVTLVTSHAGDTFVVGVSDVLGLSNRCNNAGAIQEITFGGVRAEASAQTFTFDPSLLSLNTIIVSTDLDGASEVIVNYIRSDAPQPFNPMQH